MRTSDFAFAIVFILFFVFLTFGLISSANLSARCLRNGYTSGRYVIGGSSFCVKRFENSDIVISEDSLKVR